MTGGFAKLIDLIIEFWQSLRPWVVLDSYEQGVVLRFGAGPRRSPAGHPYHHVLGPGIHWMLPFADHVMAQNVVPESSDSAPQVVVSREGTAYLCVFHVLHSVSDIVVFNLDVENAKAVLVDAVAGTLRRAIAMLLDVELASDQLEQILTERARSRAKRFGVYVERVYVSELAPMGLSKGVLRIGAAAVDHS